MIHPAIGALSLAGAILMIALTLMADRLTRRPSRLALDLKLQRRLRGETEAAACGDHPRDGLQPGAARARTTRPAGARLSPCSRLQRHRHARSDVSRRAPADPVAAARSRRLSRHQGGCERRRQLASSIMVGRCLAPIDTVIAQWRPATEARGGPVAARHRPGRDRRSPSGRSFRCRMRRSRSRISTISAVPNGTAVLSRPQLHALGRRCARHHGPERHRQVVAAASARRNQHAAVGPDPP